MKVAILAGGYGTRLSEETIVKPKPMVEIGDYPILWHIMNAYSDHGFKDFVIALGYKGEYIKRYFLDYYHLQRNLTISLKTGEVTVSKGCERDWTVQLIDTGLKAMTGGRILRLKDSLKDSTFMLTYGDGVSNINAQKLLDFHRSHGKIATVTAVKPTARFGGMKFEGDKVIHFDEKSQKGEGWINGGFFVFEPEVFDYLKQGDETVFEREPLENLAHDGQLMAYRHDGFWQCMDTLREKHYLQELWDSGKPPWGIQESK